MSKSRDERHGRSTLTRKWHGRVRNSLSPLRRLLQPLFRAILVAAFALLVLAFIYLWCLKVPRTSLVAFVATDYQWPLPPNDWALEDVERFQLLAGQNLDVHIKQIHAGGLSSTDGNSSTVDAFRRELEAVLPSNKQKSGILPTVRGWLGIDQPEPPVIIYISMHGVVNSKGEACFVPPGASTSQLKLETWQSTKASVSDPHVLLKWEDVVGAIQQVTNPRRVLLVLDSNRMLDNPQLGVERNAFVASLSDAPMPPNLAIFCASGGSEAAPEPAWSSPTLRASSFGHFFLRGIAGAASMPDQDSAWSRLRSRFKTPSVTVSELETYLQKNVGDWSVANRHFQQRPVLIGGAKAKDWIVAARLNSRRLGEVERLVSATADNPSIIDEKRFESLWDQMYRIRAFAPWRYEPIAWGNLENELLWLERLSLAGRAYSKRAGEVASRLEADLTRIEDNFRSTTSNSPIDRLGLVAGHPINLALSGSLHSIPMLEYFRQHDRLRELESFRGKLSTYRSTLDRSDLVAALRHPEASGLQEFQFLRFLDRYRSDNWDTSNLRNLLKFQTEVFSANALKKPTVPAAEPTSCFDDIRLFGRRLDELNAVRTQAEDQFLLTGTWTLSEPPIWPDEQHEAELKEGDRALADLGHWWRRNTHPLNVNAMLFDSECLNAATIESADERAISNRLADLVPDNWATTSTEALMRQVDQQLSKSQTKELPKSAVELFQTLTLVPFLSAQQRTELRRTYLNLSSTLSNLHKRTDSTPSSEAKAIFVTRWPEKSSRLAAVMPRQRWFSAMPDSPRPLTDAPIRDQTIQSLQKMLSTNADLVKRDFWGDASSSRSKPDSYFYKTSNQLSAAASFLSQYLSTIPAAVPEAKSDGEIPVFWSFSRRRSHGNPSDRFYSYPLAFNIPKGASKIQPILRITSEGGDPQGRRKVAAWKPQAFDDQGNLLSIDMPTDFDGSAPIDFDLPTDARRFRYSLRGHEREQSFAPSPLEGPISVYEPIEAVGPASITLRRPGQELEIVIVLDCSRSMTSDDKFAAARGEVMKLLEQLRDRSGVRVGLVLFGHRVGWSSTRPVTILPSPLVPPEDVSQQDPNLDIERTRLIKGRSLVPLNKDVFDALGDQLTAVVPWGQTPLLSAINEAIAIPPGNLQAHRHILVFSDCEQYVYRKGADQPTLEELGESWKEDQTNTLHFVKVGWPVKAEQIVDQLVKRFKNLHRRPLDANQVVQAIDDQHKPPQLTLLSKQIGATNVAWGKPTNITVGPQDHTFSIGGKTTKRQLHLFAEDQLDLFLRGGQVGPTRSRPGQRSNDTPAVGIRSNLQVVNSDDPAVESLSRNYVLLSQGNEDQRLDLIVDLFFELPTLNQRPGRVWVEITPSGWDHPIVFSDTSIRHREGYPSHRCVVRGWPVEAETASVEVWWTTSDNDGSTGEIKILETAQNERMIRVLVDCPDGQFRAVAPVGRVPQLTKRLFDRKNNVSVNWFQFAEEVRIEEIGFVAHGRHFDTANWDHARWNFLAPTRTSFIQIGATAP